MWEELAKKDKPLVLYGTGNAAEKIMKELDTRNIRVSGIFASDGFVRDRFFHGFKVLSYAAAKEQFGDMTVLLCFGSHLPEVMENIKRIAAEQDFYAPDLPVAGEGLFDRTYYEAHRAELVWVRERLADEQSRFVFDKVIEYKLSGRIQPLIDCQTPEPANWREWLLGTVPNCQKPAHGAVPTFLDLGAYTGDTVKMFLETLNTLRAEQAPAVPGAPDLPYNMAGTPNLYQPHIIAVEPEARNFRKLKEYKDNSLPDSPNCSMELINAAAGDHNGTVAFTHGAGRGGAEGKGKVRQVELVTVDSLLAGRSADFIKMDLEGAEAEATRGAQATIKKHRPSMLVAAYHRTEDLFAIPYQILQICPDYKLYLRKDPGIPAWGINYLFI